jgi:hypothetical protein
MCTGEISHHPNAEITRVICVQPGPREHLLPVQRQLRLTSLQQAEFARMPPQPSAIDIEFAVKGTLVGLHGVEAGGVADLTRRQWVLE